MFKTLKLFPSDGAVVRGGKILLRWGAGVIITAFGFQAVYTLLMELE